MRYIYILSEFTKTLDAWNDKLNGFFDAKGDLWTGVAIAGVALIIGMFGIKMFYNK